MPALTHGRVKNGFNGYASKVKLPNGGVTQTQPIKYNGGQQPKRNFRAEYNAQVNSPNALTYTTGSSFATKRANARRAGDPNRKTIGLPQITFSNPGQAGNKRRKVPLIRAGTGKKTTFRISDTNFLFITNGGIRLTDSGGNFSGVTPVIAGIAGAGELESDYKNNENQQILIEAPFGRKISITGSYCVESSLDDAFVPGANPNLGFFDFIKIYDSKQSYLNDANKDVASPIVTNPGNTTGLLWFSSKEINDNGPIDGAPSYTELDYFPVLTINYTSPSNKIYVHFKSDFSIVASGFDFKLNVA